MSISDVVAWMGGIFLCVLIFVFQSWFHRYDRLTALVCIGMILLLAILLPMVFGPSSGIFAPILVAMGLLGRFFLSLGRT